MKLLFKENHIKGNDEVVIKIPGVESWSITQLRYCCKNNKVKGYTKMDKLELVSKVKEILNNL